MSTFIGEFSCKADAKGRIVLPSAFKKILEGAKEERLVVKKDVYENCMVIYPYLEWEQTMAAMRTAINPYNRDHVQFFRDFQRGAAEMQLDGNGRFLVPRRLMDSIGGYKELILIGMDTRMELWSAVEMDQQTLSQDARMTLAAHILGVTPGMEFNTK